MVPYTSAYNARMAKRVVLPNGLESVSLMVAQQGQPLSREDP